MCLIALAINYHPDYPFILIANRDEFYERPTAKAGFWTNHKSVLGGKDLKANGTWMGITKNGRFSAITNFRDLKNINPNAKSRGELTTNFLISNKSSEDYLIELNKTAKDYNGFNLLTFDGKENLHFSNYEGIINKLSDGIHGLSNALLNSSWPKVELIKRKFKSIIESDFSEDIFFDLLMDESKAEDDQLPDTGIPHELEKALSSICIRTEKYGTCCSTIITIDIDNRVNFAEKTHAVSGRKEEIKKFNFEIA